MTLPPPTTPTLPAPSCTLFLGPEARGDVLNTRVEKIDVEVPGDARARVTSLGVMVGRLR